MQPQGSARLGLPSVKTLQVGLGRSEIATVKFEISVKSHENSGLGEGVSLRVNNLVDKGLGCTILEFAKFTGVGRILKLENTINYTWLTSMEPLTFTPHKFNPI